MRDLPHLAQRLASCPSADPYLSSAAYFGFTGRHGLWAYEEGDDFILFCLHPNVPGKILVFPSVSPNGIELTKSLLRDYFTPDDDIQLARLTQREAEEAVTRLSWTTKGYGFQVSDEKVLDWLFPVHTLSTARVVAHKTGDFKIFRNYLHRVDMSRVKVERLDINRHYSDIMSLTQKWANDRTAATDYSFDDLFEPHACVIRMMRETSLDLRGSVIFMDGNCVSYAIWEHPAIAGKAASAVALLAHGPSKGLGELQQLERCRALAEDGVDRVCIGGSETLGLDTYKRKMCPVESIGLKSVAVVPAVSSTSRFLCSDERWLPSSPDLGKERDILLI